MMCTLLLNMCIVGLVEISPDLYRVELLDPTFNVREYVLIRSDAQPIKSSEARHRAEPDKK